MSRLRSELQRLYRPSASEAQDEAVEDWPLIDAGGQVRALVLALTGPADWELLSTVWHGVQTELELPAPAIAVAGADGYQLWFSLVEPVSTPRALEFLDALRRHYLGHLKPSRVGLRPAMTASSPLQALQAVQAVQAVHARPVPAQLPNSDHWSAFVAPDLAPVFGDEPWLNSAPNPTGQSDLLSRLASMPTADFLRVLDQLRPAPRAIDLVPAPTSAAWTGAGAGAGADAGAGAGADSATDHLFAAGAGRSPRRFLLDVMNDASVALGLRIDAAKALLPYVHDPEPP